MELYNTILCYTFPYQNMEFHITTILKEISVPSVPTFLTGVTLTNAHNVYIYTALTSIKINCQLLLLNSF